MKCKRPKAHRPAMEGVNDCQECRREKIEEHLLLLAGFGWTREKIEKLAATAKIGRGGYLYFPWMYQWVEKKQE